MRRRPYSRRLARIGGALTAGIGPHWYRGDSYGGEGCLYIGCGRPAGEHWQLSGEWLLPRRERWSRIARRALARARRWLPW